MGDISKTYKISELQVFFLIVVCRIITAFATLPEVKTPPANQDIWIVQILSVIYIIILSTPLLLLSKRFCDMTPVEYSQKIMGKYLGKLIGLVFTTFIFFIALMNLVQLAGFIGGILLEKTPPYIIVLFVLIICTYAVFMGIEVIGRVSEIFVPIILIVIVLFAMLNINNMDFKVFLPILKGSSFFQINFGAFSIASRFSDLIIFFMLVPYFYKKKNISSSINRVLFSIVITFTIVFLIIIITTQAVLGIEIAKQERYPFYIVTSMIQVYDFIQHIESINVIVWALGAFIKFSLYLYFVSEGMSQIFKTKSNKIFIIPTIVMLFIITFTTDIRKVTVSSQIFSYKVIPYIILIVILCIPLILLITYYLRKKSITHN